MNHDPPSSDSTTSNTQNSSTKLHDQPLPSYQQRYLAQTATPQYQEIISDKETKEFLDSYFSVSTSKTLNAEVFFDLLVHEFAQRNPDLTHQIEEDEFFKGELRKLLLDRLTINHEDTVSFDALEMSTKKNGLYGFLVDMALEADAHSKLKKSMHNSDITVGELNVSNKMLNTKKEELMMYEQKLKEYEMSLLERERVMKQALQFEYERLVKSFEENYLDKVNNIMKRLMSHEKSTKLKIKQFETQVKEIKAANTGNTGSISLVGDEKSKYKVSSLEKSNDFLKNKLQEIERKLVEEQEAASKKNRTLMKKIAVLEKCVKELGGDLTVITTGKVTQQVHAESEPTSLQKLDESERTEKAAQRGRSISPQQNAAEENNDNNDNNDEEEDNNSLKKTGKLLAKKNVVKTGVLIESSPVSAVGKKKVTTVKTGQSSEFKVLLNVVHSLIVCLKSTLPIFAGNSEGTNKKSRKGSIELGKENRDIENEHPLDLGEIFYPCFDSLIGNLTELIPLLGKQYDAKYISSIIEIYYRLINFFFKFKVLKRFDHVEAENRLLSEFDIQNSTNKIKTSQDHINEIMVPSQIPKESGDVHFVPQTEYWKKLVKLAKPLQNPKTGIDPFAKENKPFKAKSDFVHIHLYTEEVIQKEVLSVLRKYLDTTEFMLKTNAAATTNTEKEGEKSSEVISVMSFHATLNLETQKYLQITRLYSSLVAILLARTKKEQVLGLQALVVDLNVENVKFAEFLRLFLVENEGLDIVFWVLKTRIEDMEILQAATNILCSLNCEGAHSKLFAETVTKEENVQIVTELMSKYRTNSEYYNKWSSIIRKLTESGSIPTGGSERYTNLLKLIG